MSKIKIIVVDDHHVVRNGLKLFFQEEEGFEVIADFGNGKDALSAVKKNQPDVLITDISMPEMNGIELTKLIMADYPEIKVLVLSMYTEDEYILDSLSAGAMGYIPKDSDEIEIKNAVSNISQGKMYYSSSLSEILAKKLIKKGKNKDVEDRLTDRETEILKFIVNGNSNKEISSILSISKRTVDNHRTNLMRKIDAKNTADIVRIALLKELVEIDN